MAGVPPAPGSGRDSIGSIMHEFVDSFPIDVDARQSISDLGKVLFTESQKPADANAPKKPYQMPKEIKGIPRQKQQDVTGITASGRVALPQGSVRKLLQTQGKATPMRWTPEEDEALRKAVEAHGERNWKSIAEVVPGRNHTQCLQRWTKVLAPGLIKGHWRPDEDDILRQLVAEGRKNWGQVATRIPGRTSKQCRERWYNHLDPNIVRGEYTAEEDQIILEAQQRIGNRWSAIAAMLPGRTEDAVKIRWKSLCRTKSGRGRRNPEKDPNDTTVSPITVAAVHSDPKGLKPPHAMGYQRSMMSELQSPMLHGGNMHGMPMQPPQYGGDMYHQQGYQSPHYGQGFNDPFMHKMNNGGYDAYNPTGYGQQPPPQSYGNHHHNMSYHRPYPQQYPPTESGYHHPQQPQASMKMDTHSGGMSFPGQMNGAPAAAFAQQMHPSSPHGMDNGFKPPAPVRQNSGGGNPAASFVQTLSGPSGGNSSGSNPAASFASSVGGRSNGGNPAAAFASAGGNSGGSNPAASFAANLSGGNASNGGNPAASFAANLSGGTSSSGGNPAASFAASVGSSSNSSGNPAASFAANLGGGNSSGSNPAASFAQQHYGAKSPTDGVPSNPFLKTGNVAASFAQQSSGNAGPRPNLAAAFAQQQSPDEQNKRPRLPLSMDAARASAARRMRQNDNHGDFVNGSHEPPPPGEVNRLSVSDINLSELGPIEEMWRVSSDMNRLSL
ncbi:myb-like DNA-binding protein [Achlya hypogyna]|uniref:Myb-like DNA-binding protein n=1 Tax=Achlya hypogyna TaxID=1202772 RepID=A0A1V9Z9K5_ACHHY|nr:myb-like DNA-binding protein [Achlya hypogyna]